MACAGNEGWDLIPKEETCFRCPRNLALIKAKAAVPKQCSADPKESANSYQGIRGYFSVMATVDGTYFFN